MPTRFFDGAGETSLFNIVRHVPLLSARGVPCCRAHGYRFDAQIVKVEAFVMLSIRAAALVFVPACAFFTTALALPARAGDEYGDRSCKSLWIERNSMFAQGGYCFQSARAISTFGNENCQYDSESDVPLSDNQRNRLRKVKAAERANGC